MSAESTKEIRDGVRLPVYVDSLLVEALLRTLHPDGLPRETEVAVQSADDVVRSESAGRRARFSGSLKGIMGGSRSKDELSSSGSTSTSATGTKSIFGSSPITSYESARKLLASRQRILDDSQLDSARAGDWVEIEVELASQSPDDVVLLMGELMKAMAREKRQLSEDRFRLFELMTSKPTNELKEFLKHSETSYGELQGVALGQLMAGLEAGDDEPDGIVAVLDYIVETLSRKAIDDVVCSPVTADAKQKLVLTVDNAKFEASHREVLVGSRFVVFGKVTNTLPGGETMRLTRRTVLSVFEERDVVDMFSGLDEALPGAKRAIELSGPALQVIPLVIAV